MASRLQDDSALRTYLNPVYPKSFPDPFVLKFRGEYFGYSTGFAADGNVFGMIRSSDLAELRPRYNAAAFRLAGLVAEPAS